MLKAAMDKLGIKSVSVQSSKVVIYCDDKEIVIESPQVTLVEGQGMKSFQISGDIKEIDKTAVAISEDDVELVKAQTGVDDKELIMRTLEESRGDIAQAIMKLKKGKES